MAREKRPRINMAFSPENHNFLTVLSRASGQTLTQLTNRIIDLYRAQHPGLAEKANDLLNEITESGFDGGKE